MNIITDDFAAVQTTVNGKTVCLMVSADGISAHIHDGDTEILTTGKTPAGMREWLERFGVLPESRSDV